MSVLRLGDRDRDWNAALNILAAVVGRGADNVAQWSERRPGKLTRKGKTLPAKTEV